MPVDVAGFGQRCGGVCSRGWTPAPTTAGDVKCWGLNNAGQLGDNTTVDKLTPVDVAGLGGGLLAIAAGGGHTCALTATSGVKCWGSNSNGQLGDNTTVSKLTSVDVVGWALV